MYQTFHLQHFLNVPNEVCWRDRTTLLAVRLRGGALSRVNVIDAISLALTDSKWCSHLGPGSITGKNFVMMLKKAVGFVLIYQSLSLANLLMDCSID